MMNRITQYRLQTGWSKEDLSRLFSIAPRIVERWERGELTPPAWVEAMIERRAREEVRRQQTKKTPVPPLAARGTERRPSC